MPTPSAQHCSILLRQRDEDRWLAARYGPDGLRDRLIALYAFHSELRRIPGLVSEPPLGEIRLQWHRDALEEIRAGKTPRAHPVIEAAAEAGLAGREFAADLDAAIDAGARPLYDSAFSDLEDCLAWHERADGAFDRLAVLICGGDPALADAAAAAGALFAVARNERGLAEQWRQRADDIGPRWRALKQTLGAAPAPCAPALAPLFLTPLYLGRGARPFPVLKRARIFAAVAFGR